MDTEFILQSAVNFPVALHMISPLSSYQGCATDTFKIYLYSEDNNYHRVDLYAHGSRSIPWQDPQNKWSHLNPQWRFTDLSGNAINYITLSNNITTTFNSTTGYLASSEFYYIDDMPTTIGQYVSIWAVADFSQYPVQIDNEINFPSVSGFSNSLVMASASHTVFSLSPSYLEITRDGINPMFDFYWNNTSIPYIISVIGTSDTNSCTAVMKDFPITNYQGIVLGPIIRTVNGISSADLTWAPDNESSFLSAFDYQNFRIGGYLKGNMSSNVTASDVSIYAVVSTLSGLSNTFNIYDFNGYDVRRFNESWDASNQVKIYARSSHIIDNPVLWDKYMKAVWGDESSEQGTGFGRESYERIANFVANHADINTCNIDQLYNLAQFSDVPIDVYGVEFPPELKRIMDIASINQQILWGSRCKCNKNITNEQTTYLSGRQIVQTNYLCKVCGHYHPGNRGPLFNPLNYMATAYTPFIIEERNNSKNKFQLITPPASCNINFASTNIGDVCQISSTSSVCITTYPLSSYYQVILPDVFDYSISANVNDFMQAITYFCFYEYIPIPACEEQIAGVINWDDQYTTLDETASSIEDWYGNGQTLERMINYTLHKGLGLIEE
ncbi:MAG: hypothetical protein PHS54_00030 [Clostridia bacterium]|nr:hypothetical protein [Clostridia bacterium]